MPIVLDATAGLSHDALPFLTGQICFFAMTTPPTGFVKCNGAALSRTTYAKLFAAIGTTYGAGDGSTTFNVPDLRGEFIRGLDDGRGVDGGRGIGTSQSDAMRNFTGSFTMLEEAFGSGSGVFAGGSNAQRWYGGSGTTGYPASMTIDASRQVPTATENRPRNIALLACIKF